MFHWLLDSLERSESELYLWRNSIIAFVLAAVLVFAANKSLSFVGFLVTLLLGSLLFLLISSATGSNIEGSLPSTTYPIPPHLGIDGVSLENRWPLMVTSANNL